MIYRRGSLSDFAEELSGVVGRPVMDRTGVEGVFYLVVGWDDKPDAEGPDIFAALREQLGLRLEKGDAPVNTLVVDHVDRVPTEN